jgi:hypothetical protein
MAAKTSIVESPVVFGLALSVELSTFKDSGPRFRFFDSGAVSELSAAFVCDELAV